MSDYEMINQRVAAQKAARRKDALRSLSFLFAVVLATVLAFVGLECIGFISELFMMILVAITVCAGSFNAGRIWTGFKR
jgi:hypothetical protein